MGQQIVGGELPGQTPLSPEDLEGLIPRHIVKTKQDLKNAEFVNISKVLPKYILKKPSDKAAPFNYEWLLKLHAEMFDEVWRWAGKLRERELNIGVKPHLIAHEIHLLQTDIYKWEEDKLDIVELAARSHHRLVKIHPFRNGNGRWARMVANIYLRKKGLEPFEWPEDEMYIKSDFRESYIKALKLADSNDYSEFIKLHRKFTK